MRLVDNNAELSQPGYYLPADGSAVAILAWANQLRSVLLPLTNAQLTGAKLRYDLGIEPGPPPSPMSDTRRHLVLFYRTGLDIGSIVLPSPVPLAYDDLGAWGGFRYSRQSAIDENTLSSIETIVTGTVFADNSVFPTDFAVGALEQIVL